MFYRGCVLGLLASSTLAAQQAPIPLMGELPGSPFAIRKTWVIGGAGNWDYLTIDPDARQLFVTHQTHVQVVDLDSGEVAGDISGFGEAHQVVLSPGGDVGYVSDGRANLVRVFDRRTFQIVAKISVPVSPRALVFEPATGMLLAFGALPTAAPLKGRSPADRGEADPCSRYTNETPPPPAYKSVITAIDLAAKAAIANVEVCGILGAAQSDGAGQVYFTIANFNQVGRLNAPALLELQRQPGAGDLKRFHGSVGGDGTLLLDLTFGAPAGSYFKAFALGHDCRDPRALAVDAPNARLFAGCANMKLKVLATDTGAPVADLIIGPGVGAVAYDANRSLIYTANGGGYGSLTVIRQHLNDSYAVIQNLPTLEQAHTMAVDPSTGLVYLVTTLYGADLKDPPVNGIGTLKLNPVDGSFRVLVIGN